MSETKPISVGTRVSINQKPELGLGTVKFIGLTKFSEGRWVGIELDGPNGKNDGTVKGDRYFECKPGHGLFVKPGMVSAADQGEENDMPTLPSQTASKPASGIRPPSSTGSRPSITPSTGSTQTSGIRPPSSVGNRPSSGSVSGGSGLKKPTESGLKKPSTASATSTPTSTVTPTVSSRPSSPTPSTTTSTAASTDKELSLDDLKKPTTTSTTTVSQIRPPSSTSNRPSSGTGEQKELTLDDLKKPETTATSKPASGIRPPSSTGHRPTTTSTSTTSAASGMKAPLTTGVTPTATTTSGIKQPSTGIKQPVSTTTTAQPSTSPSELTGSTGTPKKSKIVQGEDDDEDEGEDEKHEKEEIDNLLTKSLATTTNSVVNENMEKMMNTINELSEFKLKSQNQINDLQDQIRELSNSKEKISKDYEKQIQQLEKTISNKDRDLDNFISHQKKFDESKEKLVSVTKEKEALEKEKKDFNDQIESVNGQLELLTLDKELTEEKLEFAETELEQVKEELELLKVEYENLKIEANANNKPLQIDENLPTDVAVLQEQNTKLKETLVKLRDMALGEKHEYTRRVKELETDNKQISGLQDKINKMELELAEKLEEIVDLKQALEDLQSEQALITDLTEKNLELNEELDELKAICSDLEAFKDLSEELADNQAALEKSIRNELNAKEIENLNLNAQISNQTVKIQESEKTIQQFRDLVQRLSHKLDEMKKREEEQSEQHTNFNALQQQLLNKNQQLQSQVLRTTALEIDHQLDQYKAKEAELHLSFISEYLPEQSFQSDNDSIKMLLILKRIVLKSELAQKYLNRTYKVEEIGLKLLQSTQSGSHESFSADLMNSSKEVAHSLQVIHILDHLIISATWLSETLEHCTVENWLKSGRSTKEVNRQEAILDQLLHYIKEEQYGLGYSSEDLERITMRLDTILANVFGETQIYKSEWSMILNHILNIQYYLKQIMLNDINVTNQIQSSQTSFPQKDISKLLSICRKVVKNLLNKPNLKHSNVIRDILKFSEGSCSSILSDLLAVLPRITDHSINQETLISQMNTRVESILLSNSAFNQTNPGSLGKGSDEFDMDMNELGISTSTPEVDEETLSPMEKLFNRMINQLSDIVESILAGDLNDDSKSTQQQMKPWVIRSTQLKQSLGEVGNLYNTIAGKEQELLENLKTLKAKDAELVEEKRKEESFDKRIKILQKSENELTVQLEKELTLREKNEKAYKQAIQLLRKDASEYLEEIKQLKQKNTNILQEQKKLVNQINNPTTREGSIEQLRQMDDIQVITLKKTIKYLRSENVKLKYEKSKEHLSKLLPEFNNVISISGSSSKVEELPTPSQTSTQKQAKFNEILEFSKQVGQTMSSILETSATPKVIDISRKEQDTLSLNEIEKQRTLEKQQLRDVNLLKNRISLISFSAQSSVANSSQSNQPSNGNNSSSQNFGLQNYIDPIQSMKLKNSVPKHIGKIEIPIGTNLAVNNTSSLLLDDDIKKALNSTLLPINIFTNSKSFNQVHKIFIN